MEEFSRVYKFRVVYFVSFGPVIDELALVLMGTFQNWKSVLTKMFNVS